jgi:GMP synthase (glutamine-hydrolysing)
VQAAEIRYSNGIFWGVQYHPELSLEEVAGALRREACDLVEAGLVVSQNDLETYAGLVEELGAHPDRLDLAWRLGLDREVAEFNRRTVELRNFIERLVKPVRHLRGRG